MNVVVRRQGCRIPLPVIRLKRQTVAEGWGTTGSKESRRDSGEGNEDDLSSSAKVVLNTTIIAVLSIIPIFKPYHDIQLT